MKTDKVEAIMEKVEDASTWYSMYTEKLRGANENWELYEDVYKRTLAEIREMLEA